MITQQIKLNLIPGQVFPRVNASQYDSGTRTLQMALYNGDQVFNIASGMTAVVQGTKPDRTGFQYAATITEGSNIVTLDITQQMTAVKGDVICELVIANGNNRIATVNFVLFVEAAALSDDTVISETDLPLIEEAVEAAQRIGPIAQQVAEDAQTASDAATRAEDAAEAAETWSSNAPYIGANDHWYVYDSTREQFVDTGVSAEGQTGPQGPQGPTGETGATGPQGPTGATGNGITSITKTSTVGLVDTYTILFTDGTSTTFTVTNGQDGQGSGDMTKTVYDNTNAVADAGGIVAYVAAHSGAGTLAGLDDVTLSNLAAGDTLVYNATTQKWENSTVLRTLTNQVKDMNNVYGAKNLLILTSYIKGETVSLNGGTIKCNDDGSYTINGTFTSDAALKIDWLVSADRREISNLAGKILIASCNGYNTSDIQFYTGCFRTDGTASQVGSGAYGGTPRQYTMPSDAYTFRNWISIAAKTYSNVIIYPMVCLASVYELSSDWQSPSKTNQQLTKETAGVRDNMMDNGAVNCCNFNATTETKKGYTFTNDNGVVHVTGSRTSGETGNVDFNKRISLKAGTYKLTGCPRGGSDDTWRLLININNSAQYVFDYGDGSEFTLAADSENVMVYCTIMSAYSGSVDMYFKPMLSDSSLNLSYNDYVPYAKSNKELTEDFIPKVLTVTPNSSYVDNNNLCATKYGQLVILSGYFRVHTEAARGEVLYTLPSSVRNFSGNASGLALGNNGSAILLIIGDDNTLKVEASDGISTAWYSIMMVMLNKTENI